MTDSNVTVEELDGRDLGAEVDDLAVGWLRRQPVVAFGLALAFPAAGAVVEALASGETVRAALVAGGGAVVAAGLALVRRVVTPVADPRLDDEVRLVAE